MNEFPTLPSGLRNLMPIAQLWKYVCIYTFMAILSRETALNVVFDCIGLRRKM